MPSTIESANDRPQAPRWRALGTATRFHRAQDKDQRPQRSARGRPSPRGASTRADTLIAIRTAGLVDDFEAKAASVVETVKASGQNQIRLPGESSTRIAAERAAAGTMPIPTKIWESIQHTAQHGLPK